MITFLRGVLVSSLPDRIAVDVHGMGYEVLVPLSTYDRLPPEGSPVTILTHFHVREQEQALYGFATGEERDLFRLLINRVTGVGPKVGLAILSGMPVSDFKRCVAKGDIAALSKISGIGRKTAERIVVELKDKVGVVEAWAGAAGARPAATTPQDAAASDAILGLINLGYKQADAQKAVRRVLDDSRDAVPEPASLIRSALRLLSQA